MSPMVKIAAGAAATLVVSLLTYLSTAALAGDNRSQRNEEKLNRIERIMEKQSNTQEKVVEILDRLSPTATPKR